MIIYEAMRFIYCYGCLKSAHLLCYGIDTPHEDIITDSKTQATMFVCDRCRYITSTSLNPVNSIVIKDKRIYL